MILKNVDEVLAAIKAITEQVDPDMFDQSGELLYDAEEFLPFPYEWIQKLYPIRDGIEFIKKHHIYTPIQLSVSEIGILSLMKIELDLEGPVEEFTSRGEA